MPVSLIEALQQVEDFRSAWDRRYELWVVLLLVILRLLFTRNLAQRHNDALIAALGLSVKRLPSDSTFEYHLAPTSLNDRD